MSRQPPPLMDLNERPQQRYYIVPDIPQKPDELEFPLGYAGENGIPQKMPRGASFLLQTEWAWSPMNNAIFNYHLSLNSNQNRWVLWVSVFDDYNIPWLWRTSETVQSMPGGDVKREHAAAHLIRAYWERALIHNGLDHFHWISRVGLLDVGRARQIAKEVWHEAE